MIQRATRKRLKIRNLTRNPDFSVRLSIFRAFRSCSNQNTRSTFLEDTKPVKSKVKIGDCRSKYWTCKTIDLFHTAFRAGSIKYRFESHGLPGFNSNPNCPSFLFFSLLMNPKMHTILHSFLDNCKHE